MEKLTFNNLMSWDDVYRLLPLYDADHLTLVNNNFDIFKTDKDKRDFHDALSQFIKKDLKDRFGDKTPEIFNDNYEGVIRLVIERDEEFRVYLTYDIFVLIMDMISALNLRAGEEERENRNEELRKKITTSQVSFLNGEIINTFKDVLRLIAEDYTKSIHGDKKELKTTMSGVENRFRHPNKSEEERRELFLLVRKGIYWIMRNLEELLQTNPLPYDVLKYINIDKFLLYMTLENAKKSEKRPDSIGASNYYLSEVEYILRYLSLVEHLEELNEEPYDEKIHLTYCGHCGEYFRPHELKRTRDFESSEEPKCWTGDETTELDLVLSDMCIDMKNKLTIRKFKKDISLNWEIIPDGRTFRRLNIKEVKVRKNKSAEVQKLENERRKKVLDDKLKFFENEYPLIRLKGKRAFKGYIGFLYPNNKVVFEKFYNETAKGDNKVAVNEAIYIMTAENFAEMSQLNKTEIIKYINNPNNNDVRRIYHSSTWQKRVSAELVLTDYEKTDSHIASLLTKVKEKAEEYEYVIRN